MRKREKQELAEVNYGLSLPQCKKHKLPLVRHEDDFGDGCWDCPVEGCDHHVHEPPRIDEF